MSISPRAIFSSSPLPCDHNPHADPLFFLRDSKMMSEFRVVITRTTCCTALSSENALLICHRFITYDRSWRGFSICKVITAFACVPHRRVQLSAHLDRLDVILRPRVVCAHDHIRLSNTSVMSRYASGSTLERFRDASCNTASIGRHYHDTYLR